MTNRVTRTARHGRPDVRPFPPTGYTLIAGAVKNLARNQLWHLVEWEVYSPVRAVLWNHLFRQNVTQ